MSTKQKTQNVSIENIYRLDGRVPIGKAIPFGLQHILAIVAASVVTAIGIGFTSASEADIWNIFPGTVKTVFGEKVVAVVFVVAIILSLVLPKDMDIKKVGSAAD